MFDIGAAELLVIVIVAIIVIGPKELPLALRTAGRWIGKIRRVSTHFRTGLDAMIREAEMEEMDRKWREQNERIMAKYPSDEGVADSSATPVEGAKEGAPAMEPLDRGSPKPARTDGEGPTRSSSGESKPVDTEEPPLPFDRPRGRD